MKLNLTDGKLQIRLNPLEKVLSMRGSIEIPLHSIVSASAEKPGWKLAQVRSPGTHVPYVIKAGTYYGSSSREFWYATLCRPFLTLQLKDWDYNRVVITIGDSRSWAERITRAIAGG